MAGELVVVGVDGSADSAAALSWAVRHARAGGGTVRVVHAWTTVPWYDELPERRRRELDADRARSSAEATRVLDDALRELDEHAPLIEAVVAEGSPGAALVELSRDADLLVVGRSGQGRSAATFGRVPLGATARYTTRYAACPVTVVGSASDRTVAAGLPVDSIRTLRMPHQRITVRPTGRSGMNRPASPAP